MTIEAIELRRKYMRNYMKIWRSKKENKVKEKNYTKNYWEKKANENVSRLPKVSE